MVITLKYWFGAAAAMTRKSHTTQPQHRTFFLSKVPTSPTTHCNFFILREIMKIVVFGNDL